MPETDQSSTSEGREINQNNMPLGVEFQNTSQINKNNWPAGEQTSQNSLSQINNNAIGPPNISGTFVCEMPKYPTNFPYKKETIPNTSKVFDGKAGSLEEPGNQINWNFGVPNPCTLASEDVQSRGNSVFGDLSVEKPTGQSVWTFGVPDPCTLSSKEPKIKTTSVFGQTLEEQDRENQGTCGNFVYEEPKEQAKNESEGNKELNTSSPKSGPLISLTFPPENHGLGKKSKRPSMFDHIMTRDVPNLKSLHSTTPGQLSKEFVQQSSASGHGFDMSDPYYLIYLKAVTVQQAILECFREVAHFSKSLSEDLSLIHQQTSAAHNGTKSFNDLADTTAAVDGTSFQKTLAAQRCIYDLLNHMTGNSSEDKETQTIEPDSSVATQNSSSINQAISSSSEQLARNSPSNSDCPATLRKQGPPFVNHNHSPFDLSTLSISEQPTSVSSSILSTARLPGQLPSPNTSSEISQKSTTVSTTKPAFSFFFQPKKLFATSSPCSSVQQPTAVSVSTTSSFPSVQSTAAFSQQPNSSTFINPFSVSQSTSLFSQPSTASGNNTNSVFSQKPFSSSNQPTSVIAQPPFPLSTPLFPSGNPNPLVFPYQPGAFATTYNAPFNQFPSAFAQPSPFSFFPPNGSSGNPTISAYPQQHFPPFPSYTVPGYQYNSMFAQPFSTPHFANGYYSPFGINRESHGVSFPMNPPLNNNSNFQYPMQTPPIMSYSQPNFTYPIPNPPTNQVVRNVATAKKNTNRNPFEEPLPAGFRPMGSYTKYQPHVDAQNRERYISITCMKDYWTKSEEELRYEDYLSDRKGVMENGRKYWEVPVKKPCGVCFGSKSEQTPNSSVNPNPGENSPNASLSLSNVAASAGAVKEGEVSSGDTMDVKAYDNYTSTGTATFGPMCKPDSTISAAQSPEHKSASTVPTATVATNSLKCTAATTAAAGGLKCNYASAALEANGIKCNPSLTLKAAHDPKGNSVYKPIAREFRSIPVSCPRCKFPSTSTAHNGSKVNSVNITVENKCRKCNNIIFLIATNCPKCDVAMDYLVGSPFHFPKRNDGGISLATQVGFRKDNSASTIPTATGPNDNSASTVPAGNSANDNSALTVPAATDANGNSASTLSTATGPNDNSASTVPAATGANRNSASTLSTVNPVSFVRSSAERSKIDATSIKLALHCVICKFDSVGEPSFSDRKRIFHEQAVRCPRCRIAYLAAVTKCSKCNCCSFISALVAPPITLALAGIATSAVPASVAERAKRFAASHSPTVNIRQCLASSFPEFIGSVPQFIAPTFPQFVASSIPQFIAAMAKCPVALTPPAANDQKCNVDSAISAAPGPKGNPVITATAADDNSTSNVPAANGANDNSASTVPADDNSTSTVPANDNSTSNVPAANGANDNSASTLQGPGPKCSSALTTPEPLEPIIRPTHNEENGPESPTFTANSDFVSVVNLTDSSPDVAQVGYQAE